jgi:hypothetical protein
VDCFFHHTIGSGLPALQEVRDMKTKSKKWKKGELTTQQIVVLTILIASFAIMLILLFRLNLNEQTQAELCHNSVILKGKSTSGSGNLDCRTSYVCISGGGKCAEINPTRTIPIDISKTGEEIKNQTLRAIAEEMAECWWMFGEGKVDYTKDLTQTGLDCALCSIIKFGNLNIESISKSELEDFLKKENVNKNSQQKISNYLTAYSLPEKVDLAGKYDIITGRDDKSLNLPVVGEISYTKIFGYEFSDSKILPVTLIDSKKVNEIGCKTFITKA